MKRKAFAALVLSASMLAGCSSNTSDTSAGSQTATDSDKVPEALKALVDAAGDDSQAEADWKTLLKNFAQANDMRFTVETDGEDYLYDENSSQTLVKDNFIYDVGKDTVFWNNGDSSLLVDLCDVDDSYHALELGYGTIDRIGKNPVMTAVSLSDTQDDALKGTIEKTSTEASDEEDAAVTSLIDSIIDFGYVRTVNPISNASMYNYDLKQDGSKWKLTLSIKDLDAFKQKADTAAILIDDQNDRPVLVLDDIESETYTFTFDANGILESEENNIFHVINAITDEYKATYMNLANKAEFKKAEADDIKPEAFTDYFDSVENGSLKEGDSFTITDWN